MARQAITRYLVVKKIAPTPERVRGLREWSPSDYEFYLKCIFSFLAAAAGVIHLHIIRSAGQRVIASVSESEHGRPAPWQGSHPIGAKSGAAGHTDTFVILRRVACSRVAAETRS